MNIGDHDDRIMFGARDEVSIEYDPDLGTHVIRFDGVWFEPPVGCGARSRALSASATLTN